MHANQEYSIYDHLAPRSSTVIKGEEIAKVGMTRYTLLPHLHFRVFILLYFYFTGVDSDIEGFHLIIPVVTTPPPCDTSVAIGNIILD
jgi:murein DD-endopeptidase MepM/ murein hydrolase activator NlpD